MANETKVSSLVTVSAYIDANIAPVLRAANVVLGIVYGLSFQLGSNSKTLKSQAAQTAAVVAEAVAATSAQFQQTAGNTLLAKKAVVLNEYSEEAELFGGLSLQQLTDEQAAAISAKIDTDVLALSAGFSSTVGTTNVALTPAILATAAYTARLANAGGPLVHILHPKATSDIQQAIITSGAAIWSNQNFVDIMNGQAQPNGWRGKYLNIDVYESTNVPTANAGVDRGSMTINPKLAIALATMGGTRTLALQDVVKRTVNISTAFYYDTKEYLDGAGVQIISKA